MSRDKDEILENVITYQKTFSTVHGQQVFNDLLDRAGVFASSTDISGQNLAYWEGRRSLVLEIKSMLEANVTEIQKDDSYIQ